MLHLLPACFNFECVIFATKTKITRSKVVVGFFNILSLTHVSISSCACVIFTSMEYAIILKIQLAYICLKSPRQKKYSQQSDR